MNRKEQIEQLALAGFKPLPVKPGEKHPYVKWTDYRDRPTWPALASEFTESRGVWSILGGVTGWIVLDLDNEAAVQLWESRLDIHPAAPEPGHPPTVRTRQGYHLYFKIPVGSKWAGWTWQSDPEAVELGARYEVLADGNGVVMPPSQHAEDRSFTYEWLVGPEHAGDAPDALRKPTRAQIATLPGAMVDSTLAHQLRQLPAEGGRDVWMARVAGHLASWIPYQDAYLGILHTLNLALPAPLDPTEIDKKIGLWIKEHTKTKHQHNEESGWLVGTGGTIDTEVRISHGKDEEVTYESAEWADFDIRVKGVIDDGQQRTFVVDFYHKSGRVRPGLMVNPGLFGRSAELTTWLAAQGGSIFQPINDAHKDVPETRRLLRYLGGQDAPAYQAVDYLGWNDNVGFVTHEGVLTVDGIRPHEGVCPHPHLMDWAPYRYGEVEEATAVDVLRRVLTFQDETVTSVFASWWVMALLKGQYKSSLFPFMALEAPSESGKTRGFFAMMVALAGNAQGHGQSTAAATRDMVAGHRNGIVWLDDLTDATEIVDLIRQATSEGTRSKKGQDRTKTETIRLVSPMLVSGEGLGQVMSEKAMRDRAIRLTAPSPTDRRSESDPERPQWDDVLALYQEWEGDLTRVSGTLVRLVLAQAHRLDELSALRGAAGRHRDKMSVLRMGARVLAEITGDTSHIDRVDSYVNAQVDEGAVNYALMEIVPWSLRSRGMPGTARGHQPVYMDDDGTVWVSVERLADEWHARSGLAPRQKQLGSAESIRQELTANGCDGRGTLKVTEDARAAGGKQTKRRYVALPQAISALVVERTGTGEHETDEPVFSVTADHDE